MSQYQPFITPIRINCYAMVIPEGKAGKVGNKYRNEGKVFWGIDWAGEYPSSQLCRLTPAEYHALPESQKYGQNNR